MKFNFDNSYKQLSKDLYSEVAPTKASQPQLVFFNEELARNLGLVLDIDETELAQILSGNKLPKGAASIAQAYSGHQFGQFTTLGDGRAVLLGEQISPDGKRYDLQFKGSGITPYSRRGDGKATLSSMLREYIFSEALHALNIPTSRSLAVVATGDAVYREQVQEGAVLTRVAASHIRVGTFQHARQFTSNEAQKALTTYTINRHFSHLNNSKTPALDLLKEVMERQIDLIVNWMRVGFIHGVMNTDNMLLSGESIDFGPCAFMNTYKPDTVFSSIDHRGRYAYDQQPSIALWNITRLAESLLPQIDDNTDQAVEMVKEVLAQFSSSYQNKYLNMMLSKIGITNPQAGDEKLVGRLLSWMLKYKADYTNTFVQLMYQDQKLNDCFKNEEVQNWIVDWKERLDVDKEPIDVIKGLMQKSNPVYIPRNINVENVLKNITEESNPEPLNELISKITQPYVTSGFDERFLASPNGMFDINYKTFCGT